MIGAMKSPEAQYQLAMRLPIEQLQAILRGQPSEIDQPTALTVLKQKMQQKTALQGMQAQQQIQQPSVKERMLQQAQLPEDMGIAQAPGAQQAGAIPDGGVAGFAEGGDVRHFQTGGYSPRMEYAPYRMYGPQYDPDAEPASMSTWRAIRDFILPQTGPQLSHLGEDKYAAEKARLASLERQAASPRPSVQEPGYRGKDYVDPRLVDTKALEPVRGPARPRVEAPVQMESSPASTPDALDFGTEKSTTTEDSPAGIGALATSAAAPAAAAPAAAADTGYEGAMRKASSATQPYMDRMTELLRTMTPTAEEKESRSSERKGVMALKAAQALLQSGVTSGSARGSALGQIAELTQAYGKEDREDKKALIGAEINMLGAQAQLAQGNSKMAMDLFQHAEKLKFENVKLESDVFLKKRELELVKQGYDQKHAAAMAAVDAENYRTRAMAIWHKDANNRFANQERRAELRYDADLARVATMERNQNLRTIIDSMKAQLTDMTLPQAQRTQLRQQLNTLQQELFKREGIAAIPTPSIQIPDSRVNPRDIIE